MAQPIGMGQRGHLAYAQQGAGFRTPLASIMTLDDAAWTPAVETLGTSASLRAGSKCRGSFASARAAHRPSSPPHRHPRRRHPARRRHRRPASSRLERMNHRHPQSRHTPQTFFLRKFIEKQKPQCLQRGMLHTNFLAVVYIETNYDMPNLRPITPIDHPRIHPVSSQRAQQVCVCVTCAPHPHPTPRPTLSRICGASYVNLPSISRDHGETHGRTPLIFPQYSPSWSWSATTR